MPSMISRSSAVLSKLTPGFSQPLPEAVKRIGRRFLGDGPRDKACRSASSIRAVKVRPLRSAASLALASSSSFKRMVVLIHQSIRQVHQYVKPARNSSVSLGR